MTHAFDAQQQLADALNAALADSYAVYLKTKNFHWHVSGPNFRDYHLLLDEQGDQIYATVDPIAERVRKLEAQVAYLKKSIALKAQRRSQTGTKP